MSNPRQVLTISASSSSLRGTHRVSIFIIGKPKLNFLEESHPLAFNREVRKQPIKAVQNAILEGVDWINERIEKNGFAEIDSDNEGGYEIIHRLSRN